MDTKGRKGSGMNWKIGADTYTRLILGIKFNLPTTVAAKLLQSCPTLCNPIDVSPPGSPIPGILQALLLAQGILLSGLW